MIQQNPRIQAAMADLKRRGISVSDAINKSLEDSGVINAIRASYGLASDIAARATQPVRDTAVYKAVAASIEEAFEDDTGMGSRYGGYEEKEERRKRREARAKRAGKTATPRVKANPEWVALPTYLLDVTSLTYAGPAKLSLLPTPSLPRPACRSSPLHRHISASWRTTTNPTHRSFQPSGQ